MTELTTENLKKYIGCVKDLEIKLYNQTMVCNNLKNQMQQSLKEVNSLKYDIPKKEAKIEECKKITVGRVIGDVIGGAVGGACIGFILGIIIGTVHDVFSSSYKDWGIINSGKILGIIFAVLLAVLSLSNAHDYNKEVMEKNNKEIENTREENKKIDDTNKQRRMTKSIKENKYNIMSKELQFVEENQRATRISLENLYSLDVIYPKYRGLVYICSLHEYFESGRCNELAGANGGYNILERDIQYNGIVDRLDTVISQLDQIKNNQYELYQVVTECNANMLGLNKSIDMMANNISIGHEAIQERLDNIEYNSKLIAESSQFNAWYNFLSQK